VVKNEIPGADVETRHRAAAITQLLYSGMAWHSMRAYWGMDAEQSRACVEQALRAMFVELRRASGKNAASTSKSSKAKSKARSKQRE